MEETVENKLDLILEKLGRIERTLDEIKSRGGIGRTIGLALLADTIAESIKRPLK